MKLKHRHIMGIGLLVCGLLGFVSCTGEPLEQPHKEKDNNVFLTFHAAVAGASTRAGEDLEADERVRQLRIVIVSEKTVTSEDGGENKQWEVEWNHLISDASAASLLPDKYTFKVEAGCKKRIYLIANETGLANYYNNQPFKFYDNPQFVPDENGKAAVDDYVFIVSYSNDGIYTYTPNNIPMSAMYEFTMPDKEDLTLNNDKYEHELKDPLYVVRAATKCSFSFTSKATSKNIRVIAYGIQNVIIDRMYLMPHVNKDADGKYWVIDNTNSVHALDNQEGRVAWIDWMAEEAKKDKDSDIESYQWLTDYEVPGDPTNTSLRRPSAQLELPANTGATPSKGTTDPIYLPESKTQKATNEENPYELQEYSIFIQTKEIFPNANNNPKQRLIEYTSPLPNLASLFRNTHVRVNIVFYDNDLKVDVIPYSEVNLDPSFGLEIEEEEKKEEQQ